MVRSRARALREEPEAPLEDLEGRQTADLDNDQETELLESIKRSHELLEAERRVFEDLEFRLIEKEPSLEAETEDGGRDVEAEAGDVAGSWRAAGQAGGVHPQARAGEGEAPRPPDFAAAAAGGQQERAEQQGQRHLGRGRAEAARLSVWVENIIVLIVTYLHVA